MKKICKDKVKNIAIISRNLDGDEAERLAGTLSRKLSEYYNVYLFLINTDNITCDYGGTVISIGGSKLFYEYSIKMNKQKYNIDVAISFSRLLNFANIRTKEFERVVICERDVRPLTEGSKAAEMLKLKRYYDYADDIVTYTKEHKNESTLQEWLDVIEKKDRKKVDILALENEMLNKAEKIAIYGAGYVGKSCFLRLSGEHKIDCFAVSKRDEKQAEYLGVPIKEIGELNPSITTIVIGVGDVFQDEIVSLLTKKNFTKIVFPYLEPLEHEYYVNTPDLDIRKELILWYQLHMGKILDLDNPKTFNAKLQWLKLYDNKPIKAVLSDKISVRNYIKEKIGENYLIPIVGVWNSFDEIDFSTLPDSFVMKTNHASGTNIVVKNKADLNMMDAKQKFDTWLHMNYAYRSGFELNYAGIRPQILIEEYLEQEGEEELNDYKFMCFSGKVKCSFVCTERFSSDGLKVTFYDRNWNVMPFARHYPISRKSIDKPVNYDKMIELAEVLSKEFKFVRIDFYEYKDKIYFGEFTFYPGTGIEEFTPEEWDYKLGEWIHL